MSKKKSTKSYKSETVEEYLARGGEITKVVAQEQPEVKHQIRSISSVPTVISYCEATLMYGEKKKSRKRKKVLNLEGINVDCIPADIKKKLGL